MKDTTASADLFEDTTPAKTSVRKWILPVIFLVLVPILVAAAAFSTQAPNISGVTNVVLFVLTGLLCTLVAVALTLAGCGEWLTRIEQNIQTMAAQFVAMQDTQAHLQEAVQKGSEESGVKASQEEAVRRVMQEGVTQLAGSVQTVVANVTALKEAFQAHQEATQTALAALATGQGQFTVDLRQLHDLTQTVADGITPAAQEQAAVRGLVQDHAQALNAITEAIQEGQSTLQMKLEDVVRAGQQTTEAVSGGIADAAREQAAVRELLQDNTQAVTAVTEAIQQAQDTLLTRLTEVARAARQTVETVTTMAAEQKTAQETMKEMVADVTGTGANQVPLGEALRAHGDVINVAVAALAASEARLTEDVRQIHELTRTVAGGLTDAAHEQAAAHSSLQQVLTGTTELIQQGQNTVQTKLVDLAGTGRQTIEAVAALAAEQKTAQGQLTGDIRQLGELTQTMAGVVADAAREQTAAHDVLQQALTGTTEVMRQGHHAAQAKLDDIAGTARQTVEAIATVAAGQTALHETARHVLEEVAGVADGVTDTAREQAVAHGSLQDTARNLTDATAAIRQGQQALRVELDKLAESATQTIQAVHAVAAGQSTGREATRRMIGELANAAITVLSAGHGPLPRMDRSLEVVAQTMAGSGLLNIELPAPADEALPAPKLPAAQAIIHGGQMRYEAGPDRDSLGCWADPTDWAQWEFDVTRPGRFKVTAEIAALAPGRFQVLLGDQQLDGCAPSTGDYGRFQRVELGTVEVPAAGKTSLAVRPIPEDWQPMNLRSVELVPLA